MATDVQTPTEVSLLSSTELIGKEANTRVSVYEPMEEPTPTVVNRTTTPTINGTRATPTALPTPAPAAASEEREDYDDDPPLFSPALISDEVRRNLPEGYSIRPLRRSDYYGGK